MHRSERNAAAIFAAIVSCGMFMPSARAGTFQTIAVDGNTSEWATVPVAVSSPSNPAAPIDLVQLKMANDATNVYFELTLGSSQNPQSGSGVFLGIDSDNSAATGFNIYGSMQIGANFSFQNDFPFTQSAGNFNSGGTGTNAVYSASPYNSPTTTQEISIPLNATESDPSAAGYSGNIFNTSFTVEFYTTESTVAVLGPFTYTLATQSSKSAYASTGSGDYNVSGNWTNAVPNGVDAEADFLGSITANHTVYSDTSITLGKIVFNNASTYVLAGAGSLTLQTSTGSASVDAQAGVQKITLPTTIASNTVFQAESGAKLIIGAPVTVNAGKSLTQAGAGMVEYQSTITVLNGASVALAPTSHASSLTLSGVSTGSIIAQTSASKKALELDSLTIQTGSTFDLHNSDLVVHAGDLATISAQIKSGFNATGTNWAGAGITSSTASADSTHLTAVGVIKNLSAGSAIYGIFDQVAVQPGDILVKYTYYGDSNLDGVVDGSDYTLIDAAFNSHLTGWYNGDYNYDGVVNGSDYTLIDNAFNRQGASLGGAPLAAIAAQLGATTAVPEPVSAGVFFALSVGLSARRRRLV